MSTSSYHIVLSSVVNFANRVCIIAHTRNKKPESVAALRFVLKAVWTRLNARGAPARNRLSRYRHDGRALCSYPK